VNCPGDRLCPAAYTCAPDGCYSPDEVAACAGLAEDAPCRSGDGNGFCIAGGCATSVCGNEVVERGESCDDGNTIGLDGCNARCTSTEQCGNRLVDPGEDCDDGEETSTCTAGCTFIKCPNGIVDPGEVCDDGNLVAGDGCYIDCRSLEVCGNGLVDHATGEECDDGNPFALDGCGACRNELRIWREIPRHDTWPTPRETPAMAYDAGRRTTVLFGGNSGPVASAETWEFDGITWKLRAPVRSPPRRTAASLVYDSARGSLILFGGRRLALLADTWRYDGVTWTELDVATAPPAREFAAMAYDARRDRVVVFGGLATTGPLGDTWEFDGVTWTRILGTAPPARFRAAMVFDPRRGTIVMYGGYDDAARADVWELDATGWTRLADAPRARSEHAMVYDTARARVVAYGGYVGGFASRDIDVFDGTSWTLRTTTQGPTRARAGVAYDRERDRLVVFGGMSDTGLHDDTAELAGSTWQTPALVLPVVPPTAEPMLVEDPIRRRLVMFGGVLDGSIVVNATRELAGDDWILVDDPPDAATTAPSPRRGAAIAYDLGRRRIVLFGGRGAGAGGHLGDTWSYDGTAWTRIATTGPSPRFDAALAYDARRNRLVLFGGATASDPSAETWELDATTWTRVTTASAPPGQSGHGLVYDLARDRTVMIGTDLLVWEYDGTTWRSIATPHLPSLSTGASIGATYDIERAVTLMFDQTEVWAYDGVDWAPRVPDDDAPPPLRLMASVAYSVARRALVVAGGEGAFSTMELGYRATVAPQVCTLAVDTDGDGLGACDDLECWQVCAPMCPPGATGCVASPRCGDGRCDPAESCPACPADCACDVCGDLGCDASETAATCPGDCP